MIYNKPIIENKLDDKDISKKNIYSCPQTLFKFHPDFDDYLFDILKKDKKGILYLLKDRNKVYYLKLLERFKKIKILTLIEKYFFRSIKFKSVY